jgi:hypothetical protein
MPTIYIFECSDTTQFECFERNLFGAKAPWPLSVRTGDLCLLFNYYGHDKLIYGVFEATCDGKRDIEPDAWGGSYPCQVRVRLCSRERITVPRANIGRFVTSPETLRVRNKIFGTPADELLQYFAGGYSRGVEAGRQMDGIEEDFRRRYPRQFHCSDGHDVRSLSEQAIDEWMSTHQVYHEYERLTNVPERLIPDFTVYSADKRPVFIEFWGMLDDPAYQQRRLRKCEAYHKHRCALIELYQDDLRNLDFSLRKKLQEHVVSVT